MLRCLECTKKKVNHPRSRACLLSCCCGRPVLLGASMFSQPYKLTVCPQAPHETFTDLANMGAALCAHTYKYKGIYACTQTETHTPAYGPQCRSDYNVKSCMILSLFCLTLCSFCITNIYTLLLGALVYCLQCSYFSLQLVCQLKHEPHS